MLSKWQLLFLLLMINSKSSKREKKKLIKKILGVPVLNPRTILV